MRRVVIPFILEHTVGHSYFHKSVIYWPILTIFSSKSCRIQFPETFASCILLLNIMKKSSSVHISKCNPKSDGHSDTTSKSSWKQFKIYSRLTFYQEICLIDSENVCVSFTDCYYSKAHFVVVFLEQNVTNNNCWKLNFKWKCWKNGQNRSTGH